MKKSHRAKRFTYHVKNLEEVKDLLSSTILIWNLSFAKSLEEQPGVTEIRKLLNPAYETVARILNKISYLKVKASELTGLKLDLQLAQGWATVSVTYLQEDSSQTFNITIQPERGKDFVEREIIKEHLESVSMDDKINLRCRFAEQL